MAFQINLEGREAGKSCVWLKKRKQLAHYTPLFSPPVIGNFTRCRNRDPRTDKGCSMVYKRHHGIETIPHFRKRLLIRLKGSKISQKRLVVSYKVSLLNHTAWSAIKTSIWRKKVWHSTCSVAVRSENKSTSECQTVMSEMRDMRTSERPFISLIESPSPFFASLDGEKSPGSSRCVENNSAAAD